MTDSANVAHRTYPPFLMGMPSAAEEQFKHWTRARGSSMEPRLPSAADAGRDWYQHGLKVFVNEPSVGVEWTPLAQGAESHDAAMLMGILHSWDTSGKVINPSDWLSVGAVGEGQSTEITTSAPEPQEGALERALRLYAMGTATLWRGDDRDLQEALSDLDGLSEVAREEEVPEPDPEAVTNARSLLPKLYALLQVRYRVSPTERKGVAIDAPMKWGRSVAVECAPDDTVYCFATIDGNSRRAKFYQMDGLPDVFIAKALRDLAAG